jgi:uncharacterized Zn finger protein (UPF0148 family)
MKTMCVCKTCGRTIDGEFIYCPWCGESRLEPEDRKSMDAVFDRIVELQDEAREKRISKMQNQLDELDKELSNLALSVEMHR